MESGSAVAIALTTIILCGILVSTPVDGGYQSISVLDGRGDTIAYTFQERRASGYPEIDIISLETLDRITRVEAYLTVRDDIERSFGYIYSMSIGGITISCDNGTVQVFRISDEEIIDDVDVEVTQQQIMAEIPKSILEGDFEINASAQKYILDFEDTKTIDNYYDSISGEGASTVSQYQILLEDDTNDIRFSYVDESIQKAEHLDILHIIVKDASDPVSLEMVLAGDALIDPLISYSFTTGEDSFVITDGKEDRERSTGSISDVEISGSTVRVSFYHEGLKAGETIGGSAKEELPAGEWIEDTCPHSPRTQLDISPPGIGSDIGLSLIISGDGRGELIITTSGYDSDVETGLLDSLDKDQSGHVDEVEKAAFLDPVKEAIETDPIIIVNGRDADIDDVTVILDTDGAMEFTIRIVFTVDVTPEIGIEILPLRENIGSKSGLEMNCEMEISVPEDHRIDPFSLEPFGLGNHISAKGNSVNLISDDPEDLDLFTTGMSFTYKERTVIEPSEDPVVYEDIPQWAYVLGIVILIIAVIVIYRFGRGKRTVPEDYYMEDR